MLRWRKGWNETQVLGRLLLVRFQSLKFFFSAGVSFMRIRYLLRFMSGELIGKSVGHISCLMAWLFVVFMFLPNLAAGGNGSESPDTKGNVGRFTSLVLDSKGNPVVSYEDLTNRDLKLLHCDDPNCSGDETINISTPDSKGMVGTYTSIALDTENRPIVSYFDSLNGLLTDIDTPTCPGCSSAPRR
jgi:hypothetical protein